MGLARLRNPAGPPKPDNPCDLRDLCRGRVGEARVAVEATDGLRFRLTPMPRRGRCSSPSSSDARLTEILGYQP